MPNTEIVLAIIGVIGAGIGAARYVISKISTMQGTFLSSQEKQQQTLLNYIENKNGHMERIAKDFSNSQQKMAAALNKLSLKIKK